MTIKSAATAVRINELVQEAFRSLNQSIRIAQDTEEQEDFNDYRHRAALVISGLYEYILHDLWLDFPELEPEEMRRPDKPPA